MSDTDRWSSASADGQGDPGRDTWDDPAAHATDPDEPAPEESSSSDDQGGAETGTPGEWQPPVEAPAAGAWTPEPSADAAPGDAPPPPAGSLEAATWGQVEAPGTEASSWGGGESTTWGQGSTSWGAGEPAWAGSGNGESAPTADEPTASPTDGSWSPTPPPVAGQSWSPESGRSRGREPDRGRRPGRRSRARHVATGGRGMAPGRCVAGAIRQRTRGDPGRGGDRRG